MENFHSLVSSGVTDLWPLLDIVYNKLINQQFLSFFPNVVVAMILGCLMGLERRAKHKNAGVRTLMVIAGASALISSIGVIATQEAGLGDPTRIAAQLLASVGFIGAGVILKRGIATHGVTTAATILLTVGIGMACGFGYWGLALASTIVMVISLVATSRYFQSNERCHPISVICLAEHEADVRKLFGKNALLLGFARDGDKVELCLQPELTVHEYEMLLERLISNSQILKVHAEEETK